MKLESYICWNTFYFHVKKKGDKSFVSPDSTRHSQQTPRLQIWIKTVNNLLFIFLGKNFILIGIRFRGPLCYGSLATIKILRKKKTHFTQYILIIYLPGKSDIVHNFHI